MNILSLSLMCLSAAFQSQHVGEAASEEVMAAVRKSEERSGTEPREDVKGLHTEEGSTLQQTQTHVNTKSFHLSYVHLFRCLFPFFYLSPHFSSQVFPSFYTLYQLPVS